MPISDEWDGTRILHRDANRAVKLLEVNSWNNERIKEERRTSSIGEDSELVGQAWSCKHQTTYFLFISDRLVP
jgi:hypothetical protein